MILEKTRDRRTRNRVLHIEYMCIYTHIYMHIYIYICTHMRTYKNAPTVHILAWATDLGLTCTVAA